MKQLLGRVRVRISSWTERVKVRRVLRAVAINTPLVLGSFAFAFLLAELAIRVVAPQQLILIRPDLWEPADSVGWLHRPNVDTRLNTGERTVRVMTDAAGFRVGEAGPSNGDHTVLVLGDSFMEALQVEHEASFAGLLEAELGRALAAPVAVRNAGMAGWSPDQYLIRARTLLAQERYDLVVVALYLGNDVEPVRRHYVPPRTHVTRHRLRLPRGVSMSELTDAFLRPLNDMLEVRSHLYVFVRSRLETVRMRLGLAPLYFPPQFERLDSNAQRWRTTLEIADDIDRVVRDHGAESLFVMIPAPFQVDAASLSTYLVGYGLDPEAIDIEQPNRAIGEGLIEREILVLDALPGFRAAKEMGMRMYGTVDPHLSPEGHIELAEIVAPTASSLLRDGRGPP